MNLFEEHKRAVVRYRFMVSDQGFQWIQSPHQGRLAASMVGFRTFIAFGEVRPC